MSDNESLMPGTAVWFDLTVPDAEQVRDFYASVIGWESEPMDMGDYADYVMKAPGGAQGVAGICHTRGENADLPAQWLNYVVVPTGSLPGTLPGQRWRGGHSHQGPRRHATLRRDPRLPAGAYLALMEIGGDTTTGS